MQRVPVAGDDERLPGLSDAADEPGLQRYPGGGSGRQLSGAGRHLEQPRPAQFHQFVPAEPEPGRHPGPLRQHAHRPGRDPQSAREGSLGPRTVHV